MAALSVGGDYGGIVLRAGEGRTDICHKSFGIVGQFCVELFEIIGMGRIIGFNGKSSVLPDNIRINRGIQDIQGKGVADIILGKAAYKSYVAWIAFLKGCAWEAD